MHIIVGGRADWEGISRGEGIIFDGYHNVAGWQT